MKIIKTTDALGDFCKAASDHDFVTLDTEFLRERTYYAQLCLVQMAFPGAPGETENAAIIDVLADGLSLDPLYDLMRDTSVVKVFHAARQDLEIFCIDGGVIPDPLFDTQVAAMVCGFGEQVGYETLVRKICKEAVDKSSRFTDWSRRPLSDKQLRYALADVTFLRDIYVHLRDELESSGRQSWVAEEMRTLTDPDTYVVNPKDAWRRVKTRNGSSGFLAIVKELAEYREALAQSRNIPRNRVFKDDVILEVAATKPKTMDDLGKSRLLQRDARRGDTAEGLLNAVRRGLNMPPEDRPKVQQHKQRRPGTEGLADLLRVLLKASAASAGVAQKLIATTSELDDIASDDNADTPALRGWRREVFGADAERLKRGEIALSANGDGVEIVEL